MADSIAEIRAKVAPRIKDAAGRLTTAEMSGDVDLAIIAAVEQYQKDKPRLAVIALVGAAAFDYAISLLAGFVDGFSSITKVVYPYDATSQILDSLEAEEDYTLVRLPAGVVLRFLTASPRVTESILVEYTVPHSLTGSASTVPATDDEALADLSASYCCEQLAAYYAQSVDASIAADSVDRRSQSQEYRSLAKLYAERYAQKVGKGAASPAAGVHVEVDRRFSDSQGTDYFFHGRRRF